MSIVWQVSAIHLEDKTLITGVILKHTPFTNNRETGRIKNFFKVAGSYYVPVLSDKQISIAVDGKIFKTETDSHGGFSIVTDFLISDIPDIKTIDDEKSLEIVQRYPVIFRNTDGEFDVISDIDDTIMVSKTGKMLKRMGILAFISPHKRKIIPYTHELFKIFEKEHARVTYVSKSESNFFAMISTFIEHNDLPEGSLILTSYLKLTQLLNPNKGQNYKLDNIRFIIKNSGNKSYVLLGDDSQRDMEIYTNIIEEFPDRIIKVYIRQTGDKIRKRQKEMWEKLKQTGISVNYFDNDDEVIEKDEMLQLVKNI
jgi:phosphatidate phosphatase APP1